MGRWLRGLLPHRCLSLSLPLVFHLLFTLWRWGLALRYLQGLSHFVKSLFMITQAPWVVLLVL